MEEPRGPKQKALEIWLNALPLPRAHRPAQAASAAGEHLPAGTRRILQEHGDGREATPQAHSQRTLSRRRHGERVDLLTSAVPPG